MTTISWLIVIIVASCYQSGQAAWLNFADLDKEGNILVNLWNHVTSFITWFNDGGYDLFDLCPEMEEPDWDQFEPEGKRCRKLSDLLTPKIGSWQSIQSGFKSYAPDLSTLRSSVEYVSNLAIWQTLYSIVFNIVAILLPYLVPLWEAWHDVCIYASSLKIFKWGPIYLSRDHLRTCLELYLSNFVLYNNTSLPLMIIAACLTAIFVICNVFSDGTSSCTLKRVTFSSTENHSESSNGRPQRLARIKPPRSSKKDKQRKKKRQRQRTASRDSSTDHDTSPHNGTEDHTTPCCLHAGTGSDQPDSSHIDDEALRYIVGSATDTATDEIKERIRTALQVIARHEEEECCRPSPGSSKDGSRNSEKGQKSRDSPGSVVYDIRYKDKLPQHVMDVLFCIDPKCQHDHSRYEMRGCQILVKPPKAKPKGASPECRKAKHKESSVDSKEARSSKDDSGKNAYSTIEVSPTEVHVWGQDEDFVHKYHETLSGQDLLHGAVTGSINSKEEAKKRDLSKRIRGPDALDQETQRADSFSDWSAPLFEESCPYCKISISNDQSPISGITRTDDSQDASSSDLSTDSSGEDDSPDTNSGARETIHPSAGCSGVSGPHPKRTEKKLMELIGEAALEVAIGPPQANSSFQREEEEKDIWKSPLPKVKQGNEPDLEYSSQKILRRRANKNRPQTSPNNDGPSSEAGAQGPVMYGSLRIVQPPTRDPTRNGDAIPRYPTACRLNPVFVRTIEPLTSPIQRVPVRGDGESRPADDPVGMPVDNDSLPPFDEDEFSLTQELQDTSLNDSNVAIDLGELNRSLSFYGDVSMLELAASWIVQNVLDRATKCMSAFSRTHLKESLLDISTGIIEAMDLIE